MLLNINRLFLRNNIVRTLCLKSCISTIATSLKVTKTLVPLCVVQIPEKRGSFELVEGISLKSCSTGLTDIFSLRNNVEIVNPLVKVPILDLPFPNNDIFRLPTNSPVDKSDIEPEHIIEAPSSRNTYEKQAARLIVIRRRKMKKHKLKKLRKKMKFEWAKVRQRRELRKEKAFQALLIAQVKEGEKFDAAEYVSEKLRLAQEVKLPRKWKGKRLPEFIIKQKLGIKD